MKLVERLINKLIRYAERTPYFNLKHEDGSPYMYRYWLIPDIEEKPGCYVAKWWKNPLVWVCQKFGIAVRIHRIVSPDDTRHMHDHPWWFISIVLRGFYVERVPMFKRHLPSIARVMEDDGATIRRPEPYKQVIRKRGSIIFKKPSERHAISNISIGGVYTLFITGPWTQKWGFYTPEGKVPWDQYEQTTKEPNV